MCSPPIAPWSSSRRVINRGRKPSGTPATTCRAAGPGGRRIERAAIARLWWSGAMNEPWTAPETDRTEPERVAGERTSLEQWLDYHRATLLMKCAGLTADQLKQRPLLPSRLSLLGLVRHMGEVERWWYRMHAAGEAIGFVHDSGGVRLDVEETEDG